MTDNHYDYLEQMVRLKNDGFVYRRNDSKRIIEKLKEFDLCEPASFLYKIIDENNFTGTMISSLNFVENGPTRVKIKENKSYKISSGIGKIGSGKSGVVYMGCFDRSCNDEIAIKFVDFSKQKTLELEFKMLKMFDNVSLNIPKAYSFNKCPGNNNNALMYYEYFNGGDLLSVIQKHGTKITDLQLRTIIFQIIITLYLINKQEPTFRHNDLHIGNVLLDLRFPANKKTIKYKYGAKTVGKLLGDFYVDNIGVRAGLSDFGFSNIEKPGFENSLVQSGEYIGEYGIYPKNDAMYDVHLFLNTIYSELSKQADVNQNSATMRFIKSVIPPDYLGKTTPNVKNFRLRSGIKHNLPTFEEILSNGFFVPFRLGRGNVNAVNSFPKNIYIEPMEIKKYSRNNLLKMRPSASGVIATVPANISSTRKYRVSNLVRFLPGGRLNNASKFNFTRVPRRGLNIKMVPKRTSNPTRKLELLDFGSGAKYTTKPAPINMKLIANLRKKAANNLIRKARKNRAMELLLNEAPYINIFNNGLFEAPRRNLVQPTVKIIVPETDRKAKKLFSTLKEPVRVVRPINRGPNFRPRPVIPVRPPPVANKQKAIDKLKQTKVNKVSTKKTNAIIPPKNLIPMSISSNGELKIKNKLCRTMKKDDVIKLLTDKGLKKEQISKLTVKQLCELVSKKYLK